MTTLSSLAQQFSAAAAQHDRDNTIAISHFDALHAAGLLRLTVPASLGGGGAGLREVCRVVGTIAEGDPSTALVLAMHNIHHAVHLARGRWPATLHASVIDATVQRGALINSLRAEPELGSPERGGLPGTVAQRVDGGWSISGHKIYATGCEVLSWYLVWARTDEAQPRVGVFLVPADSAGIRIVRTWDHLGMRATGSHDVVLEQVAVPLENAVDVRAPGEWGQPDPVLALWTGLPVAALYLGVARAARDWLVAHVSQRVPTGLGAPLASLPLFQEAIGRIEALLHTGERLVSGTAGDFDDGLAVDPHHAGLCKVSAIENAIEAVELALGLTGNAGLSRNNPLERHYRDVLCARIHAPQPDSILVRAGRNSLGY